MTDDDKKVIAPRGGQADATATGQPEGQSPEPASSAAEAARKAFPRQVEAALGYAASNTYDYGPRLRKLDIEHTVESATSMGGGITRVVLSYRPAKRFKGASGSEYLDVDPDGVIQARRQLRPVKENRPWVLMSVATLSVIAAAVLVPLMFTLESTSDPLYVSGRTIYLRAFDRPKIQPYVSYDGVDSTGTERKWIIVPEGDGTAIAFITLEIHNETSGTVTLSIDADAAELRTEDNLTIYPVDINSRVGWPAEGAVVDPRTNVGILPLWGDRVLLGGESLKGFMAFEVPLGARFQSLRWSATDTANIRF